MLAALPHGATRPAWLLLTLFLCSASSPGNAACSQPSGVAIITVAVTHTPHQDPEGHFMRWLSIANRRAYAALHGFAVYASTQPLTQRQPSWDKFVLASIAFQHACAEWVWVLDSDAFVMNLNSSIMDVLASHIKERSSPPDVVVARGCMLKIFNSGSLLLRNTPWTRAHISQAWAFEGPHIRLSKEWCEQAALIHMFDNIPEVQGHYHFVPQAAINSFPPSFKCGVHYEDGHLVLHFPDVSKKHAFAPDSEWVRRIPIDAPGQAKPAGVHQVFQVVPLSQGSHLREPSDQVEVSFGPSAATARTPSNARLSAKYLVVGNSQGNNPGFPVPLPRLWSKMRDESDG